MTSERAKDQHLTKEEDKRQDGQQHKDQDFVVESDSLGEVRLPKGCLWGPQTQRSLENFPIGTEKMPMEIVRAFAHIKKACAEVNHERGLLTAEKKQAIEAACQRILAGEADAAFPLSVWQTGSGTQTNMNVNEFVSKLAQQEWGLQLHPNDDVNCSQSSNDTFPTAMHLAALEALHSRLYPALDRLVAELWRIEREMGAQVKIGRTHLQDAVPMTFGQEVSGWRSAFARSKALLQQTEEGLHVLALGGTAVGTGLNTPPHFAEAVIERLEQSTGLALRPAPNKMFALSFRTDLNTSHGAIRSLAADWLKFVNDIRFLASGPRCGLGELILPANEPGSSIMPGKVNPTQCESAAMVAVQVMGNDASIALASSQGHFQLNVFLPMMIHNYLQSVRLLADSIESFVLRCLRGLQVDAKRMQRNVEESLMLVTALNPHIGYKKAAQIAQYAHQESLNLKQAAVALGILTAEQVEAWIRPEEMCHYQAEEEKGAQR